MTRILLLAALLVAPLFPARAADLAVTLTGVLDGRGRLEVGVCSEAEFLRPACRFHGSAPSVMGDVTLTVRGISPGVYAVSAFQDVDGSGRLKTGFFGVPTEPVGFSRDPPLGMHKPRFADSAIRIAAAGGAITIRMGRY